MRSFRRGASTGSNVVWHVRVPVLETNSQCYEKRRTRGNRARSSRNLCYTRDGRFDWTIGPARHIDAHPGGHAKWVRNPHGPATVSGERFHTVRGRASDGQSLDFASGKTVNAQRAASQETWA